MASFFGEILPVISRAVDEDEEEDDQSFVSSHCVARWTPEITEEMSKCERQKLECPVVVVAIGPAATGFVHTYIMNQEWEKLGVICSGLGDRDINTFAQTSFTDKSCFIYRLPERRNSLVVCCNVQVAADQAHSWVTQLFSKLELENAYVAVLGSALVSEYKSETAPGDLPMPFLRALKTTKFKGTPLCPYLEQPNTITGLPAQILTYCHVHQVAAVLYTCYTETMFLDTDVMKAFKIILRSTPVRDLVADNPAAEAMLAKIVEMNTAENTLYI